MPLEISEIGIRMAVGDTAQRAAAPGADSCNETQLSESQKQDIVERCVRQVLQSLRSSEAR